MSEQVTLEAEFLRRALGQQGSAEHVSATPGALPPDLPVTLPDLPGMRMLGGVRSVAPGWTFVYPGATQTAAPIRLQWRVFVDVPTPQPEVMDALVRQFAEQGWQETHSFPSVFVEANLSLWEGFCPEPPRTLVVQSRQQGGATQVNLTLTDAEPEYIEHLRGERARPHLSDYFEAPLPTLILPGGWRGQMVSGQGGAVRSFLTALQPSPGTAPDPEALLDHFLPQLERQGWHLLHREDSPESLSVFRTPLGVGTLTLRLEGQNVSALIVHATAEDGGGSSVGTYTLSSS